VKAERVLYDEMPTWRSIHWLPVGDTRYVVASLRSGNTTQLFVRQDVLIQLNAIAAASRAEDSLGLLLGHYCTCRSSGTDFLAIDALGSRTHSLMGHSHATKELEEAVRESLDARRGRAIGWYFASGTADQAATETQAAHAAVFPEELNVLLTLTARSTGIAGTFSRRDAGSGAMYRIPFREVAEAEQVSRNGDKPTCITWPTYITGDATFPAEHPTAPALPKRTSPPPPPVAAPVSSGSSAASTNAGTRRRMWNALRPAPAPSRPEPPPPEPVSKTPGRQQSSPPESAPLGSQIVGAASPPRPITDQTDTALGGSPTRFIEVAEHDGFYAAARFDTDETRPSREVLWVLHDPYTGLLLLLHANDATVLDATLHYNIQTTDPQALKSAFSEHRDLDAKALYMREPCIDQLRAKCERLRASGTLLAEWKVRPPISFITPSEWALLSHDPHTGARAVRALNERRIASLPEPIVTRYGLHAR
jgi:hypothetical protein